MSPPDSESATGLGAPLAAGQASAPRVRSGDGSGHSLVFLGTYTHHDVLPHWPRGGSEGDGLMVGRWCHAKDRLEVMHTVPVVNPAFMKYHPHLNVLYVLSECIHTNGYLTAFSIDPETGAAAPLAPPLYMTGKSSCYISFDADASHAVVANYFDGRIDVVELDTRSGAPRTVAQSHQQARRPAWRQVVDREDHMSNRQDGPHAHCTVFHPSYRWLFVPDLGDNCIHQYGYANGRITHQAHITVAPGDGPRHFVFHPTLPIAYSGCELKSQVQVFAVDASEPDAVRPRITPVQRLSTLPEGWSATNYVGEIKVDAGGRHVYVSNRGHHSIATFKIDPATGLLERQGIDAVSGKTPRHFGLAPCGKYVVVGVQDSDVVRVFTLCPSSGRLIECVQEIDAGTPNFVLFCKPHPAPAAPVRADGATEARGYAVRGAQQRDSAIAVCAN